MASLQVSQPFDGGLDGQSRNSGRHTSSEGSDSQVVREVAVDCPWEGMVTWSSARGGVTRSSQQAAADARRRREQEQRALRELEPRASARLRHLAQTLPKSGIDNPGFYGEESTPSGELGDGWNTVQLLDPSEVRHCLEQLSGTLCDEQSTLDLALLSNLMHSPTFLRSLALHRAVATYMQRPSPPFPRSPNALHLAHEIQNHLNNSGQKEGLELCSLLSSSDFQALLSAHDIVARREMAPEVHPPHEDAPDRQPQQEQQPTSPIDGEPGPRIVYVQKARDIPLGATVRNDGEAVVVSRIVRGGTAQKNQLLHEGDEILEIDGIPMRGRDVNEVSDLLADMQGTLTFLVKASHLSRNVHHKESVMHVKALFDYDPLDDPYIPCRELGLSFQKGDILHVISQEDANWWQALREGEEENQPLAGLIPGKSFQQQREVMKLSLEDDEGTEKSGKLWCAKKNKKKRKKMLYNSNKKGDVEEVLTYEEMALYHQPANRKRPIILVGPASCGRSKLHQRMLRSDSDRFADPVYHTSRPVRDGEVLGQHFHFVSRAELENDMVNGRLVDVCERDRHLYGIRVDSVRQVVNSGKTCLISLYNQSPKILKLLDLKPYVVFVAPPPQERLRALMGKEGRNPKPEELREIIEKAREMEQTYGHYFDTVVVNADLEKAFIELLHHVNKLDTEPQYVPAAWLR
uniref:protein PALS1 isoform X2 n=1 Tax=Myxine glutinosa TaxID=7769 RepID=UPI00358F0794